LRMRPATLLRWFLIWTGCQPANLTDNLRAAVKFLPRLMQQHRLTASIRIVFHHVGENPPVAGCISRPLEPLMGVNPGAHHLKRFLTLALEQIEVPSDRLIGRGRPVRHVLVHRPIVGEGWLFRTLGPLLHKTLEPVLLTAHQVEKQPSDAWPVFINLPNDCFLTRLFQALTPLAGAILQGRRKDRKLKVRSRPHAKIEKLHESDGTHLTPWSPTVELSDSIAARLIAERFPSLAPLELKLLGTGWDNHAYLVNGKVVIRIPHRELAGALMRDECRVLRHLNQYSLPLAKPRLEYHAEPDETYPYTIAGYGLLPGNSADSVLWTKTQRGQNARRLGEFLAALHRIPIGLPDPPTDTLRRADISFRVPSVLARVENPPPGFVKLLTDLATTPPHLAAPVWVHGDLYTRHLVVQDHEVTGVIDWGDSHVGDPALDIAIAWMFLPPESWDEFREAYGGVDKATWRRARFRTMTHWTYLSEYARAKQDAPLLQELAFVLQNVLS
jgi:aminoglycoside phosphotransferase (APT) family kinase protein